MTQKDFFKKTIALLTILVNILYLSRGCTTQHNDHLNKSFDQNYLYNARFKDD